MLKLILYIFIFFFILAPVCTLIHEFGHALIPLYEGIKVSINIGKGHFIYQTIGNLSIKIGLLKPWIGYTDWRGVNNYESISLILGPVFSFVLSAVFLFIGISKRSKLYSALLFAGAGWCVFQFIFTFFPFSYPEFLGYKSGMISDGARILELMN
jgi:hypothetical protein